MSRFSMPNLKSFVVIKIKNSVFYGSVIAKALVFRFLIYSDMAKW